MKSDYGNVFFSCLLLGFHQTGSTVQTDDQTAGGFGVQSSRMPCFFNLGLINGYFEYFFNPGHDFVGRRVGWFVQIYDSVFQVLGQRSIDRSRTAGQGSVVTSPDVQLIVILLFKYFLLSAKEASFYS